MRQGYINLIESLRLLADPEVSKDIANIELHRAGQEPIRTGNLVVTKVDILAEESTGVWVYFPTDELVGFAVEFAASAPEKDLPKFLAEVHRKNKASALAKGKRVKPVDDDEEEDDADA